MEHFKHINWHENVELIRVLEGTGSVLYGDKIQIILYENSKK